MKHLKTFEARKKTDEEKKEELELFNDLFQENPLNNTHDFYIFIASDTFVEDKDGLYKKTIDIENMVRLTPDESSIAAIGGMEMRVKFQHESNLYHIWLPKEIRKDVEGKSSKSIESWLLDLINQHKRKGADEYGKKVYRDVKQRREDMGKYNL